MAAPAGHLQTGLTKMFACCVSPPSAPPADKTEAGPSRRLPPQPKQPNVVPSGPAAEEGVPAPQDTFDKTIYQLKLGKYLLGTSADLGKGGFGIVAGGVDTETGEEVAIKIALQQNHSAAELKEVVLQACLAHENIVLIKDICYDVVSNNDFFRGTASLDHDLKAVVSKGRGAQLGKGKKILAVVMEKIDGGELFDFVLDSDGLSEDFARGCFRQILMAMAYCHGRGVAHRDMKLENLLLTADKKTCMVCDFGLAKNLTAAAASTVIGTAKYVSPEVLTGAEYDGRKADIWSCGVCLYCMVECRFPFSKSGDDGVGGEGVHKASARDAELMRYLMAAKYSLKPGRSPEFVAFLKRLLCVDPALRYTAAEALADPWVLGKDWTAEAVATKIAALDTSAATVPGNYDSRQTWVAKVEEMAGEEDDANEDEDDKEDGF